MIRSSITVLFASIVLMSCEGPMGQQGPVGAQGPQGTQGEMAMPGSAATLPWATCTTKAFDKPAAGDLGKQLEPLLNMYSCVIVNLPAKTKWTWNQQIAMKDFQSLTIYGGSYDNNSKDTLSTEIDFTQHGTFDHGTISNRRNPNRVLVGAYGQFQISGVIINETAADARDLTPRCFEKALFSASSFRGRGSIILSNAIIRTSESIAAFSSEATIRLVHVWAENSTPMGLMRPVYLATAERDWCEVGVQANIFIHNYNPTNIVLDKTAGLTYLP